MNTTLLINNIDPERQPDQVVDVFFQIGNMKEERDKLMDLFNRPDCAYYGKCYFKYDGFDIKISISHIPVLIQRLVEIGIQIYGVYSPYMP
ncbi:MAG: hypothetical protein Q4E37_03355 [Tissierellia bacterium]|nr:hypothetical protein [Tissierellia bacterium]